MVHLLLLLAGGLFCAGALAMAHDAAGSGLHPLVLLPGYSCSQLDARLTDEYRPPAAAPGCGARKGHGWFRLWENYTAVQQDNAALVPCFADQLRLVFDPVAGDYRNVPGVKTRVVSFGTTRGFGSDDPAKKNTCMEALVAALEGVEYREGETLFGAPYDFRQAAAPPGAASRAFSDFLCNLRQLVEHASERNGGKPVILVTHSLGGLNALAFLRRSALPWRRRYVKHLVMIGTGAGGGVALLQTGVPPSPGDVLSFANTTRTFATPYTVMPSPRVFGRAPLVVTPSRNFSAYDIPEFLAAAGYTDGEVARYVTRALPVTLSLRAPGVPMTCVNGVGVPTAEKLVYRGGDLGAAPEVVYGDGDGLVNAASILALDSVIEADPEQDFFKSILIHNATHTGIISDGFALRRVVNEVLEADRRATY